MVAAHEEGGATPVKCATQRDLTRCRRRWLSSKKTSMKVAWTTCPMCTQDTPLFLRALHTRFCHSPTPLFHSCLSHRPRLTTSFSQLLRRDFNVRAADELLRPIAGPLFEEVQEIPAAAAARAGAAAEKPKVTIVFFIGGITFTEISALRWLAKAESRDIVICTTKLISGQTFLESLTDKAAL